MGGKLKWFFSIFIIGFSSFYGQLDVEAESILEKPVAVFYSPHQDDELLTMGHAITMYVQNGYEVHVTLLTDGSSSNAIHAVNQEVVRHDLEPLSVKEFSNARNLEFVRSLKGMGVERKNIHMERLKDGGTTTNEIETVVLRFQSRFPNAVHLGMSFYDDHIDHRNSGLALESLYKNGIIEKPKFYIQNNERDKWNGEYEPYKSSYDLSIRNAMIPYLEWNPLRRMYSIGDISVSHDFNLLKRDPRSKFHSLR